MFCPILLSGALVRYDTVHHFIKPATMQRKCSYVELVAEGPQLAQWLPSQTVWDKNLRCIFKFVSVLQYGRVYGYYFSHFSWHDFVWELGHSMVASSKQRFLHDICLIVGSLIQFGSVGIWSNWNLWLWSKVCISLVGRACGAVHRLCGEAFAPSIIGRNGPLLGLCLCQQSAAWTPTEASGKITIQLITKISHLIIWVCLKIVFP